MHSGHLLSLLATNYRNYFNDAVEQEQAAATAARRPAHAGNLFHAAFEDWLETHAHPPREIAPPKTKDELHTEVYQSVSEVATALFAQLKKTLGKGVNKGVVKLTSLRPSWPEQSLILRTLFQRYLNVELHDPQAQVRSCSETLVSISWEKAHSKVLSDLLDCAQKKPESKTNGFRLHDQFCDCVLKVGEREFTAHKVILSKKSPYFEKMFSAEMQESKEKAPILLQDATLRPEHFEQILEYIYTGSIQLQRTSHSELILLSEKAKMFGLPKLEFLCNRLLVTRLSNESWMDIATHALRINDGDILRNHAAYFIKSADTQAHVKQALEALESVVALSEKLELTKQYKSLEHLQMPLETRVKEGLTKETFHHYCELGASLNPNASSRKFIEALCRKFVDTSSGIQEWLNAPENGAIKNSYIRLLTGIIA